jgi:GxxExxY protein
VDVNDVTGGIIASAIQVHRELGPGLLESAYEACLAYELERGRFTVERQKPVPLSYRGLRLDCGYRLDVLVNNSVIVELKAVPRIEPIHVATVITYLKLTRIHVGLLINFHSALLKDGIRRIIL